MSGAGKHGGASKVIVSGTAITMPHKGDVHLKLPLPLPCITILVHGVNDVGEAYQAQETGLCAGLNARLDRAHGSGDAGFADLVPGKYSMPPVTPQERLKEGIKSDPDAVYFRRTSAATTWSPVVPFYWGSRENDGVDPSTKLPYIKKDNWHGQWTDRYGNRLDKNGAKNGGPFANATTTLNAMWATGFSGKVANSTNVAGWVSDPLHNLKKACPRLYMLLAAKRLAMLIKIIRSNPSYQHVAINLLCHSQGSMVALTAHAMLAEESEKFSADTLILQDSPYSIEETIAEFFDGTTGNKQQTTQSRLKTLSNIVRYVGEKKSDSPLLADLTFPTQTAKGVTGPLWKPGKGAKQWVSGKEYTFTERDNRGKVYLYFCPHDSTVALMSVQGIGWAGVPDHIRADEVKLTRVTDSNDAGGPELSHSQRVLSALPALGDGFRQRVFTSRQVNGSPVPVGAPPMRYEMRKKGEKSTTGEKASVKEIAVGETRVISGEELNPSVQAVLTVGEDGHAHRLSVSPIDAAIAVAAGESAFRTKTFVIADFRVGARHGASPLTADEMKMLADKLPNQRSVDATDVENRLALLSLDRVDIEGGLLWGKCTVETPNEARARWQNQQTDDNSYHSAVPGNPAHAAGVTAYDLSLGAPLPVSEDDTIYMEYLRAVADWRTDWRKLGKSKDLDRRKIFEHCVTEKTPGAIALFKGSTTYYATGELPLDIEKNDVAKIDKPKLIVSQTVLERSYGKLID